MLKIATLNCRGLTKNLKRKAIFRQCTRYDIICLQETLITKERLREWELDWKGELFYSIGTNLSKGQIILVNEKHKSTNITISHTSPRIIGIIIELSNVKVHILNIYGPNEKKEKIAFIDEMYNVVRSNEVEDLVICGDFNIVFDNNVDIIAGAIYTRTRK